mmetsp:Transcript_55908/g.128404  ORF Transcript_55908/g.128404 Transcript_55908/m.128404 type:complete len:271 (+) Transcript_55908:670-1482(+)
MSMKGMSSLCPLPSGPSTVSTRESTSHTDHLSWRNRPPATAISSRGVSPVGAALPRSCRNAAERRRTPTMSGGHCNICSSFSEKKSGVQRSAESGCGSSFQYASRSPLSACCAESKRKAGGTGSSPCTPRSTAHLAGIETISSPSLISCSAITPRKPLKSAMPTRARLAPSLTNHSRSLSYAASVRRVPTSPSIFGTTAPNPFSEILLGIGGLPLRLDDTFAFFASICAAGCLHFRTPAGVLRTPVRGEAGDGKRQRTEARKESSMVTQR